MPGLYIQRATILILAAVFLLGGVANASDFSALFAKVDPAVVTIKVISSKPQITSKGLVSEPTGGLGTGVIINRDGSIMTAAHVVQNAESIEIELANGKKYPAHIVSFSGLADLAMLKLDNPPKELSVATFGDSDQIKTGAEVFVIGTPYGLGHTLTVGHLSGRRVQNGEDSLMDLEFLQTDAPSIAATLAGRYLIAKGNLSVLSAISSRKAAAVRDWGLPARSKWPNKY